MRSQILVIIMFVIVSANMAISSEIMPVIVKTSAPARSDRQDLDVDWLQKHAYVHDGFTRLILGTKNQLNNQEDLQRCLACCGARIVNTVSIKGKATSLIVEVPLVLASSFARAFQDTGLAQYIEPNMKVEAEFVPNDANWTGQWGPRKIGAEWAWNITRGSHDVLVAVVDTGIDYTHPDLAANYVPLGYDWVNNDADPKDDHGHGTHVAGIMAAVSNNSIGIAGLAQVSVMAEKVLSSAGEGYFDQVANGIIHATDQGARVVSMSLGSTYDSQLIHDAVKYAYESGVLVIAAAGNDGSNTVTSYPAGYNEVIAVSATDESDGIADFSNMGKWIEVAAPGVGIYSTMPTYHVTMNDYGYSMNYTDLSGTSMATPHVSGVAALIWSCYPNMTRDSVRYWLRYRGSDLGPRGSDFYYGHGRIDAYRSVNETFSYYDLVALSLDAPVALEPNASTTVEGTILNLGMQDITDVNITFLKDGVPLPNGTNSVNISRGNSTVIACQWRPTQAGTYNLTLNVYHWFDERVRNNNITKFSIVRGPTTLQVPSVCSTIGGALDEAISGDTINVSDGEYKELIWINKPNVRLLGKSRETTTIRGWGPNAVVKVMVDNATISGFTIEGEVKETIERLVGTTGILLSNRNSANISLNGIRNSLFGIEASYSRSNIITGNMIGKNFVGILGYQLDDSTIADNIIQNHTRRARDVEGHYGLILTASSGNWITNNTLSNNEMTVVATVSDNNIVAGNSISDSQVLGLSFHGFNNTFIGNIISNNGWEYTSLPESLEPCGFILCGAFNTLRNNTLADNRHNFHVAIVSQSLSDYIQDIDPSNTVDGKPIYYWVSQENRQIPYDAGYVALVDCTSIRVENVTLQNNVDGMLIAHTQNSTISHCNITENTFGVWMVYSSNNILWGNRMYNSEADVFLDDSSNNVMYHNDFLSRAGVSSDSPNVWDAGYPDSGNYWVGYQGIDQKSGPNQDVPGSDRIGDSPYVINTDNQDRYPMMNPWTNGWVPDIHDIAVTNLTASNTRPNKGESIQIYVTVRNLGGFNETFTVRLYVIGGENIGAKNITLAPQTQSIESFQWNVPTTSGNYVIRAEVIPVAGEANTQDNQRDLIIIPAGGGGGGGGRPPLLLILPPL